MLLFGTESEGNCKGKGGVQGRDCEGHPTLLPADEILFLLELLYLEYLRLLCDRFFAVLCLRCICSSLTSYKVVVKL